MTSKRPTSETKQGGQTTLTIPGTSMTFCILSYCACETERLSQITDNTAADKNQGEGKKKANDVKSEKN